MSRNRYRVSALIVAGLIGGPVLLAQQSTGTLKGRVTDKASGAAKANVTITIENVATGFTRSTQSNADGLFRLPVLPLGNYRISFKSADSVASMARTVALGQETDASVAMAPAAAVIVTVTATADTVAEINTTSAEVGVNVSADRLETLPVISRNIVSATVLAPGIQVISGSQVDPTKKGSSYMTQGDGQGRGTNFNIDGGDNNSTDVGGYVSSLPMDAVGEFQVVTNQYKAEFGRSNAGFLNVVSKAGSNTFAGVITGQYTDQSMRAMTADEGTKQDQKDQSIGATVSGPILKDKLFYMFSVEKRTQESPSATFSPEAIAAYPGTASVKTKVLSTVGYARIDWSATPWLNVTGTYSYDKNETPNQSFGTPEFFGGNSNLASLGTGLNKTNRAGLKFVTNLSSNVVWESNLVYFDYANNIRPMDDPDSLNGYYAVRTRTSPAYPIPTNLAGWAGFDANSYQNTGIRRFQWRNDVSYFSGDHALKGGFDFQRYTMADSLTFYPVTGPNIFSVIGVPFGPQLYGAGLAGDTNVVRAMIAPQGLTPGNTIKQYGFYAQDDWTVNPKWSVYVGIRADKDTSLDFMQSPIIKGIYSQIDATSHEFIRGNTPPPDKTYISPRLQVVYKPNGDDTQVYKFGYGRFVANTVDNITGYARKCLAPINGINGSGFYVGNGANAISTGYTDWMAPSFAQGADWGGPDGWDINGHHIVLPADLTPYNYSHNVHGLRDYFNTTVNSWLLPASFSTGGKQLLAADFVYPQTDTFSLSGSWKLAKHHAVEATLLWSRTEHMTVNMTASGADFILAVDADGNPTQTAHAPTHSIGPNGAEMGDTIFYSNQKSENLQFNVKYTYNTERINALFNVTYKNVRGTNGGAGGAFDASGGADFYGGGTTYPWQTGAMRPAKGTEHLMGSFAFNYIASWGTNFGLLGSWHGPKQYDVYVGYAVNVGPGYTDSANPSTLVGTAEGKWNMDLGLRIGHQFKLGRGIAVEPFLQVQNLLNNYDYGTNYYNTTMDSNGDRDPNFGMRKQGFQSNTPRMAAVGFRMTF